MRIGLDFDNTIVCYDKAITLLADELFVLPQDVPRTKLGLRDYLRGVGRESDWTAFQGQLYGPGMRYSQPFRGAIATMQKLSSDGHELMIVSHRSRWPYAGHRYDLHEAAQLWIASHLQTSGLFAMNNSQAVHFMETKKDKISKIAELSCEVFLDDLPEVLDTPEFPASTIGILFNPGSNGLPGMKRLAITTWEQLINQLENLT
jgi:hypothetical protein